MALIKKKLCLLSKDQEDGILALVKGHISSYPTLDLTLFYKDLCRNFPDRWICALGPSFSYNISRASKGICIIGIQYSPTDVVNLLIYSPPYTELSNLAKLHYEPAPPINSLKIERATLDSSVKETVVNILESYAGNDYTLLAERVKQELNRYKPNYWHVLIGQRMQLVCNIEDAEEFMVSKLKVNNVKQPYKVYVFRMQGVRREVKTEGMMSWIWNALVMLILFISAIAVIRCDENSSSLICTHHKTLMYVSVSILFAKSVKKIMKVAEERLRRKKLK